MRSSNAYCVSLAAKIDAFLRNITNDSLIEYKRTIHGMSNDLVLANDYLTHVLNSSLLMTSLSEDFSSCNDDPQIMTYQHQYYMFDIS